MEEDITKYEWMAQLSPFNTVFQAELLAIQEACLWVSKTNQQIKVWSDSKSSLHSIASIDTKSPIAQQTQEILLKSTNIKLGWIKAHVGYSGNEAADVLAKKATQEGFPHTSQRQETISRVSYKKSPSSAGKKKNGEMERTMEKQAGAFITFCQKSRQLLLHGKGQKYRSSRSKAHFQHILKDSTSEAAIPVAVETWETPYTMLQVACLQHHTT
ncbi:hypothetical protein AVEN_215836-1 [Araneus ventricosus]|uniref:RNase H type-1 domain-containing protein n=1 Tax=Araneus ventricosus TaxID=182803 RepID=A0A4Y2UZQ1_ARAVE|nr:hypothetical protein AVEN_215836-1 [Araneus ventricosus]